MSDEPLSGGNRGPLGRPANSPLLDYDTLVRQPSRPPVPHRSCSEEAPAFGITAQMMLQGARALMDQYAREIFDLWFSGKAPAEVVFDNQKWADYMRAEKRLPQQIENQLAVYADRLRDAVDKSRGRLTGNIDLPPFHAEVGQPSGGVTTGYDVLHGTNKAAGGFAVGGRYTAVRSGGPGSAYAVTFENLSFVFNDIVDINKRWKADVQLGRIAANMANCLGTGPPRDFTLRIKWRAEKPVTVQVNAKGEAPAWLKQFPNR